MSEEAQGKGRRFPFSKVFLSIFVFVISLIIRAEGPGGVGLSCALTPKRGHADGRPTAGHLISTKIERWAGDPVASSSSIDASSFAPSHEGGFAR